ncbi:hypothetical protein PRUPE_7G165100 [Prunus persica]|uniref:Uncharacterized protein n=1 Tax=Prunus persica TaxID=3760 RepID=A0A251NFE1_PRUPE|nr:hypothetical protein PRUPE_7G165100 [Prunus persica]
MRNHKLGFVEDASFESFIFDEQYNTFHKYGYAVDPSSSAGYNYIGDFEALQKNDAVSVYNIPQHEQKKKRKIEKRNELEEAEGVDDDMDLDGLGFFEFIFLKFMLFYYFMYKKFG